MTSRIVWIRVAVIIAAAAALELACRGGLTSPRVIIPPTAMVVSLVKLLGNAEILYGLQLTLGTVLLSFLVALVGGAVLGFVIHRIDFLRRAMAPVLAAWYAVPH